MPTVLCEQWKPISPFPWPRQIGGAWWERRWFWCRAPPQFLVFCLRTANRIFIACQSTMTVTFQMISVSAPTRLSTWIDCSGFRRFSLNRDCILKALEVKVQHDKCTYIKSLFWLKALILSESLWFSRDFFFFGLSLRCKAFRNILWSSLEYLWS